MRTLGRREFTGFLAGVVAAPAARIRQAGAHGASPAIQPPGEQFLGALPKLMEVTSVPGVAMGVVQGGKLHWERYAGVTDVTTRQAVTGGSVFQAASLGKPVFAYAALLLAGEGKLDLDRPLRTYVLDHAPSDPRGDMVTARHVLSHSSGFRNWRNSTDQRLVPDFDPGDRFQYSGEGFYYLQHAVEKIGGRGLQQFMEERLFVPLGMGSSTYGWRADTESRLVTGHNRGRAVRPPSRDFANRLFAHAESQGRPFASFTCEDVAAAMAAMGPPTPRALPNFMIPNAASSLLTTVADYAAFVGRVLVPGGGPTDLAAATRNEMLAPHTKINSALAWGLGWGLESDQGRDYIWHWGDNGDYKNFVLAHRPSGSAIVVFANGNNGLRIAEAALAAATGHKHLAFDWL
jgi:CubicO group peptidase (beta-lactamase class C family)